MSLEDMKVAIERSKIADWLGKELLLIRKSGRLEKDYLKYMKNEPVRLAYQLMEKLEKKGYQITKKPKPK